MSARIRTPRLCEGRPCTGVALLAAGVVLGVAVGVAAAIDGNASEAWTTLLDGADLGQWKPTSFGGDGDVSVVAGTLRIAAGTPLSGVTWSGDFPRQHYEISLEARRVEGGDFFCGLTFPVGDDACSLILGGWGGGLCGLSCIDGSDASENDTTQHHEFERGRWYDVVVRVTPDRITCLLDGKTIIDQAIAGRRISVRPEIADSRPLGIATYDTSSEVRDIRWRPLPAGDGGR